MPFWFDLNPHLQEELDDNSLMSVDDKYDPEAKIKLKYYEQLARIVSYKGIIIPYMKKSHFNFVDKKIILKDFMILIKNMGIVKSSMIKVDKFLIDNPPLAYLLERFLLDCSIPPFSDERLAQIKKELGRTAIKREKTINTDDALYQEKMAKKEEANVLYRVFVATNEDKIIAD